MEKFIIKRGNKSITLTDKEVDDFSKMVREQDIVDNSLNLLDNFDPDAFDAKDIAAIKENRQLLFDIDEKLTARIYNDNGAIEYAVIKSCIEKMKGSQSCKQECP